MKHKQRGPIGRKRLGGEGPGGQSVTFDEWMEGGNAKKFATREAVVSYSQFQLRNQIMPLVGKAIEAYAAEIKQRHWYRRLWRWIKGLFVTKSLDVADLPAEARADLRDQLDAAETPTEPPRTCVTCGSAQLEPVNEAGGLRCDQGHIVEDPPPTMETRDVETTQT